MAIPKQAAALRDQYAREAMLARIDILSGEIAMLQSTMQALPTLMAKDGSVVRVNGHTPKTPDMRPRRKRAPMTKAQRLAVGVRMRKFWAAKRRAEGKG